jgi:hypothetical protein
MLIWIVALLLFAGFGAIGYFKGAIRMVFPLVGLFLGLLLALPLAPVVRPLVPMVGLENPIWGILLPPVVVFFVVSLVFIGVGFFGHARLDLFFKYRADDIQRLGWQRLNQRLGACVGLVAGAVYTVLIGVVVYVLGYLTVQVSPESEGGPVGYLNQARSDLRTSGLEQLAAVFDPAPASYYRAADVLGLLYHNQPLHTRLASYPPFIALSERPDFQEFANDTEFHRLLASQPAVAELLEHEKIKAILGSQELLDQLRSIDLSDLQGYLMTGVSEQFQYPPILGRWEVDPYLTFLMEKRRRRDMTAADVRLLRFQMEFVKGFKLYAMPEHEVRIKGPEVGRMIGRLEEIEKAVRGGTRSRPPVQVVAPSAPQTVDPNTERTRQLMAERYGINRGVPSGSSSPGAAPATQFMQVQPAPAPAVPAAPATAAEVAAEIAQLPFGTLAEGAWRDEDGRITLTLRPQRELTQFVLTRRASDVRASVREERLYLTHEGQTLVMARF